MKHDAPILVSGVKPTGRPHIGNYLGAMKQFADLQDTYQSFIFIADLHALTSIQNKEELSQNTLDVALDYLAIGIDPKKTVLYRQSDVPEVVELAWIFNCITTMPYLMRAHAFKDAEAKNREINVGVFAYPLLMAADILIHNAEIVPVGHDQKQHIEIARDTAEKFNRIFGEIFTVPNSHIIESVQIVPGTDGQKMSKSYKNTIGLFSTKDEIKKAVMSIPTDSKGVEEVKNPEECNVFKLHVLFTPEKTLSSIREKYKNGGIGYKESKDILVESINAFVTPFRERRAALAQDMGLVKNILEEGGKVARARAQETMKQVRIFTGFE